MKAEHLWQDQGIQTFRMLLVPHADIWKKNNIVRPAEEFIAPSMFIYQGIHDGALQKSNSFLSIDPQDIIVSSIKIAESGEDLIFRCVETSGIASEAILDLKFVSKKWTGRFRPYEIKTLRMNKNSGEIREVNLLEE
jgi:alpha-mannosidase